MGERKSGQDERLTDLRGADCTSGEDDLLVRGDVVHGGLGATRELNASHDGGLTVSTRLEDLRDLGVDEDIEVRSRERGDDVVPCRVGARTILDLYSKP